MRFGCALRLAFGVDGLVEIDPEDAGKECDCGCEGKKQHDGPDDVFRDPPAGHRPQQCGEECDDRNSQSVADVHRAEEVARFAIELEIADGAAVVHLGKPAEDGIAKNASRTAAGAALAENISRSRELCRDSHRS